MKKTFRMLIIFLIGIFIVPNVVKATSEYYIQGVKDGVEYSCDAEGSTNSQGYCDLSYNSPANEDISITFKVKFSRINNYETGDGFLLSYGDKVGDYLEITIFGKASVGKNYLGTVWGHMVYDDVDIMDITVGDYDIGEPPIGDQSEEGPAVQAYDLTLYVGESANAISKYNLTGTGIDWRSSNTSIATVNKGVITGVKAGTTTVYASSTTVAANISVTVKNPTTKNYNDEVEKGSTLNVKTKHNLTNTYTWTSSNTNVATVNKGVITGVKGGTTTIIGKSTSEIVTITLTVTESSIAPPIERFEALMYDGNTLDLKDEYSLTETYTWTSSDPEVAKVDKDTGKVTAIKSGTVTITGTNSTSTITVVINIKDKTVTTVPTPANLAPDEILDLSKDKNAPAKAKWTSSDPEVAKVDKDTGKVTAIKSGTVTITGEGESSKTQYTITVYRRLTSENESDGVSALVTDSSVNPQAKLSIVKRDKSDKLYTIYKDKIKNVSKMVIYDVNLLLNGEKIQPNGEIVLEFDIPQGYDYKKIAVYRVENNGSLTKLNHVFINGKIQVKTDHFSDYIVTELSEETNGTVIGQAPQTTESKKDETKNPQTGASVFTVIISGILVSSGIFYITKKKKLFNRI